MKPLDAGPSLWHAFVTKIAARLTRRVVAGLVVVLAIATPGSLSAQPADYSLFDRFSLALEGSIVQLDTKLRLDSVTLGIGTEIDFESAGGLDEDDNIPSLSFDWRVGRRHRVGGWWQDTDRSNARQLVTEIRFGDTVFPVDEEVVFSLGEEEFGLSYTYFPSLKNRVAIGVGGGVRTLRMDAGLSAVGRELAAQGDFTGPLPFIWGELRYGVLPKLRLVSNLGLFYIEIGDYTGEQVVLDLYLEHLTLNNLALGVGIRGSRVDVDVDTSDYSGTAEVDIAGIRVFARLRL